MKGENSEPVEPPIVEHSSTIVMKTIISTPMIRTVGGLGVTYGAGQKVLNV